MVKLNKTISEIWKDDYIVPLYQRNFAWGETQISQLIQDIYDAYKNNIDSHYYIGSLVVLQRPDGIFEVIDGQQRLTTLHMLCKTLGLLNESHLSYESRPEVEEFFAGMFRNVSCKEYAEECKKKDSRKIFRLVEAIEMIESLDIHEQKDNNQIINLSTMCSTEKSEFAEYLNNNVIIVRTILPGDTDVAAYFEIMNNRGEQLQEHEIVKALMMKDLSSTQRATFSSIWDACSQMNIPIQKSLGSMRLNHDKPLFGENYDKLNLDFLPQYAEKNATCNPLTINEILSLQTKSQTEAVEDKDEELKYEAIIDFPNFLMHIFKFYDADCQLNANGLLKEYYSLSDRLDANKFICDILKYRTLFDRYVIKCQGDGEEDENLKWVMLKPYLQHNKQTKQNSLRYKNTFSESTSDVDENEVEGNMQKRIIKQESFLQVSFRNKKYKNWLFELLQWLGDKNVDSIVPQELIAYLDKWILKYYNELETRTKAETEWAFEALGTETPYFVFNFIDYLYWVEAKNPSHNISYISEVHDFYFKYYNSVEHHLPQSYKDTGDVDIDNIGNLCLISRRKNSSLNDKAPKEKARMEDNLQPKRRIMYQMTQDSDGQWGAKQIRNHYQDIVDLLNQRKEILL